MTLERRIEAFSELGNILLSVAEGKDTRYGKQLRTLIETHYKTNQWFTPGNVSMAVRAIAEKLTEENIKKWTCRYPWINEEYNPLKVVVIMAGNIPLAGFHDFMTVLISGNMIMAKTSSKDSGLISAVAEILSSINSDFRRMIEFTDGTLSGFDIVIATGSDNSSRYFEYYFGKYPHIIRKNRNSVAILEGSESNDDYRNLGTDIFSYFGLGCRNVSKIYIPAGFDFERLARNWSSFSEIKDHSRYANNYEHNMAVFMVNRELFIDTGFLLLRENSSLSSPVAVLNYQYYGSLKELRTDIESNSEKIQCIVSNNDIPFGLSQSPELWDYADNIDTLDFLLKKNRAGIL